MDWDDLRHFLALARSGSVRAAGGCLGVSHSTVARRVEALEQQLSTRLFDRNRDGYTLTEAGRQMLPRAERVERELAALERSLVGRDEKLEGRVRLTCCDEFVSGLMMPRLLEFCDAHPGIELEVTADSRPFDLSKREADLAVRVLARGAQPPEHLMGRTLVPMVMATYVGRDHAALRDPDAPGSDPRWVAFDDPKAMAQMVSTSSHPAVPQWGSFASLGLMAQAVREGAGIGLLPTYIGDPDPGLRRARRPDVRHVADLWLLCHPDLRANARLRAARQVVRDALRAHDRRFRGDAPEG